MQREQTSEEQHQDEEIAGPLLIERLQASWYSLADLLIEP